MQCRRCNVDKLETDFRWKIKAKNIRQTVCADCAKYQSKMYREIKGDEYNANKKLKYHQNIDKIRIDRKEDYAKNKEKFLAAALKWRSENPEKYVESRKKTYLKYRDAILIANDEYARKNKDSLSEKARARYAESMKDPEFREKERLRSISRNREEKLGAINAYGGKCQCCGETEILFLTVDHVNGNGNVERRELGTKGGVSFYRLLRKSGYPQGYQILCFNCNVGKHINGGVCPHRK